MSPAWDRRVALGKKEDRPTARRLSNESLGWHSRGYLPHFDAPGLLQHITFHLADSLPADAIKRMQAEMEELPESEQAVERRRRIHALLDAGHGRCVLREQACAQVVEEALLYGDNERYQLLVWVVMPNHVHVLIEQKPGWPLEKVVQSWKRHTSRQIHRLGFGLEPGSPMGSPSGTQQRKGNAECHSAIQNPALWQRDYWDRFVRDERHFQVVKHYIEENPVAAGLAKNARQWPWGSAHLEGAV